MVRELTGGIYFGKPRERREVDGKEAVVDTLYYEKPKWKESFAKHLNWLRLEERKLLPLIKQMYLNQAEYGVKQRLKSARNFRKLR